MGSYSNYSARKKTFTQKRQISDVDASQFEKKRR